MEFHVEGKNPIRVDVDFDQKDIKSRRLIIFNVSSNHVVKNCMRFFSFFGAVFVVVVAVENKRKSESDVKKKRNWQHIKISFSESLF